MPNDTKNTNSSDPIGQPANTTAPVPSIDQKVIESSRAVLQGTPPAASNRQPTPAGPINQPVTTQRSTASPKATSFSESMRKRAMIFGVILIILVGGYVFFVTSLSGLGSKTLSNGGYTYSFKFYKSAHKVRLSDGSLGYKGTNGASVKGQPVLGNIPTSCSKYGGNWQQVFTVQLNDMSFPVCTSNDQNYALYFTALDHSHLFIVAYSSRQTSAATPTLKTIFSSVRVTQ